LQVVARGRLEHCLADLACPLGRGGLRIEVSPLIDLGWSRPPDPPPEFSDRSPDRCEQGATSQPRTARTLSTISICSVSDRMARDTGDVSGTLSRRIVRSRQAPSSAAASSAQASTRCSQLSNSTSVRRVARWSTRRSVRVGPPDPPGAAPSRIRSTLASCRSTSAGSDNDASSTSQTPSG
jgi:hypothetical protein